jgi:zinc protease
MPHHGILSRPFDMAALGKVERLRSMEIYKDIFSSLRGFTIVFVGDFDVEKLIPVIVRTFDWTDAHDSFGHCDQENEKRKLISTDHVFFTNMDRNKAIVRICFSGGYIYEADTNVALDALGGILQLLLTDKLREQESKTYSIISQSNYSKYPTPWYRYQLDFDCRREDVDYTVGAVLQVIADLKATGINDEILNKYVWNEIKMLDQSLNSSSFWRQYLIRQCQRGARLDEIQQRRDLLTRLTVSDLKLVANKYLDISNFAKFVLLPNGN